MNMSIVATGSFVCSKVRCGCVPHTPLGFLRSIVEVFFFVTLSANGFPKDIQTERCLCSLSIMLWSERDGGKKECIVLYYIPPVFFHCRHHVFHKVGVIFQVGLSEEHCSTAQQQQWYDPQFFIQHVTPGLISLQKHAV